MLHTSKDVQVKLIKVIYANGYDEDSFKDGYSEGVLDGKADTLKNLKMQLVM